MRGRHGCSRPVPGVTGAAAVLAVGLLVLAGCGSAPDGGPDTATATGMTTRVVRISPLRNDGGLRTGYTVTATHAGHCWTPSLVNGKLYRCFNADLILDPCWKQPGHDSVVCLPQPWSTKLTRLRLTKPLPARTDFPARYWALRVGGSAQVSCTASMGATGLVGKRPISYTCPRGWGLLGKPDRTHGRWTIAIARRNGHDYRPSGRVPVITAWEAGAGPTHRAPPRADT